MVGPASGSQKSTPRHLMSLSLLFVVAVQWLESTYSWWVSGTPFPNQYVASYHTRAFLLLLIPPFFLTQVLACVCAHVPWHRAHIAAAGYSAWRHQLPPLCRVRSAAAQSLLAKHQRERQVGLANSRHAEGARDVGLLADRDRLLPLGRDTKCVVVTKVFRCISSSAAVLYV